MPVCQVCQHNNPEGAEYCEECGAALAPKQETAPVGTTAPSQANAPSTPSQSPVSPASPSSLPTAEPSAAATPPPAPASPPPATGSRPRLLVRRYGALTGDEVPLQGERLVVGRFDPETGPVDVDLSGTPEAEHVSRQHAELYRETEGRWFVRDLGSTNGVFVKGGGAATFGPRISEPRALADGDELAFGNARFIFTTD